VIYLDHAASTPVKPQVAQAMRRYLEDLELMANPSSIHSAGRLARSAYEQLRGRVAAHFNCEPRDVIFNSGGSEGDTQALVGTVRSLLASGNRRPRIAISAIEHEAVVKAARFCKELGAEITEIACDDQGLVSVDALHMTLRRFSPQLVSVMAVNNEIGSVQPVAQIAELCAEFGAGYHCDAVRAVGHGLGWIQRDPRITLLTATAHKFGGPRGCGVMVVRGGGAVLTRGGPAPLICGGGQEHGLRAGTESLAGAAGFAEALDLAEDAEAKRIDTLRESFEKRLRERWPDAVIHGDGAPRATGVCSFALPDADGAALQKALDKDGICVGVGSACHSDKGGVASPTLRAMGVKPETAAATLRVSFGWNSMEDEVTGLIQAMDALLP
jgi:cysteine desulfurase